LESIGMSRIAIGASALLGLLLVTGCGGKQETSSAPAAPPAEETRPEEPAPEPKVEQSPAAETPPLADEPQPSADEKGSTAARPSLLFSLMLQPVELVISSTMESMQAAAGPLLGGNTGLPRLPGLGAGGTPPVEMKNEAPTETKSEAPTETKSEAPAEPR
jgi:hypothetical protein